MIPEVFSLISGIARPSSTPAMLKGFERRCLSGKVYPGVRKSESAQVDGVIFPVTKLALPALDRYEGDMYLREKVTVETTTGEITAWCYVLRPRYCHLMLKPDWQLQQFCTRHLPDYLARLKEVPYAPR